MKYKNRLLTLFCLSFIFFASSFKAYQIDVWEDLEVFHQAIALTFHPAEDGDFEPIRNDSKELLEAAQNLSKSKLPTYFEKSENDATKKELLQNIQQLLEQSEALHKLAQDKTTTNEMLLNALKQLHATYHRIEEVNSTAKKK